MTQKERAEVFLSWVKAGGPRLGITWKEFLELHEMFEEEVKRADRQMVERLIDEIEGAK